MIFERFFNNNEPDHARYAVYKCSACGKVEWIRAHENFQTRPRKCSACGVLETMDSRESLEYQRKELMVQLGIVQGKLDRVNTEIGILDSQTTQVAQPVLKGELNGTCNS